MNNLNNNISINKDVHLVINVDDVLINHIGIQHKGSLTTYGLNETRFSYKKSKETVICPKCNQNLKYNYYHYNNYGDFECKCGFKRLDPMFLATNVNLNKLTIKVNNSVLKIDKDSYNSIYRSLLAFTFGNVINIPKEKIINCINSIPVNYSNQIYKIDNRNVKIIDNKNSNAVSFEQSMEFVMRHHGEKTIILGIDDNKKNTSLLWDFDFENLDTLSIDKIICIGKHKWDVATRLMYAGIPEDKLIILSDINSLLEITKKDSKGDIFLMFYYDVLNSYS